MPSVPEIAFVVCDLIALQEVAQLFLEAVHAMMLLLVVNVSTQRSDL